VLEVSLDCGFNNLSHFNKQFKKFKGITPSQYRN
ncbi:MAG: helix-turn-helix domain-containing protein, partial [Bacteroidota bacterium]